MLLRPLVAALLALTMLAGCTATTSQTTSPTTAATTPSNTAGSPAPVTSSKPACGVPVKRGIWDSVLCADGSPNPAVRADLTARFPTVMALPANATWTMVVETMCTVWTGGADSYQFAQAYEFKRAEHGWTTFRPAAEIPEMLDSEEDPCRVAKKSQGKLPRHDCPMPMRMQNGTLRPVLCDDGSPNAKIEDDLRASNPRTMALAADATIDEAIAAVCSDRRRGSNQIALSAYEWKLAEQGWATLPSVEEMNRMIVDEDACAKVAGSGLGQTAEMTKVSITVDDLELTYPSSAPGYYTASIRVTTCSKEPVNVGSIPWTMITAEGTSYQPVVPVEGNPFSPRYPSGKDLSPGDCASGWLHFELPNDSTPQTAKYTTTHGDNASWTLG
ncbi:DUF4352 domain-containing protein [Propionibacteriaceae bacterium G1746]|uniref:DUF4352 domain-containing protein n=1 Tax=Aestuariimicrobium sp. G57 TaxID=3418485 RepID=UPI003C1F57D9